MVEDSPSDYKTPDELTYRTTATGGLYADQPDAAPAGYYAPVQQAADWQKVGPSEEQLAAANETGAPISGNEPRTQEAADQLNSVRPSNAPQATYTPPVYGSDPNTGAPLKAVQESADANIITRFTPFDEVKNAIAGEDGIVNWGDVLNPINLAKNSVLGLGSGWDKGRQRLVEAMGEEGYNRVKYGDANYGQNSLADKVGNALLVPYQAANKWDLSAQGPDKQTLIGYNEEDGNVDGFTVWLENPDNAETIKQIYEDGYNGYKEGRALWEYYISDKSMVQKGVWDTVNDPVTAATLGLAAIGGFVRGGAAATKIEKIAAGTVKAANIALDPLGEVALPLAAKGAGKAVDVIPGAAPVVDAVKNSKLNPFGLTADAKNRIALDEAVTRGEELGRQMDQLGRYTGIPETPTYAGRNRTTGEFFVRDAATGVARPFDTTNPMGEFVAADKMLRELDYDSYIDTLNRRSGGVGWYDLLYNGEKYGLPKFYDAQLTVDPVAHERYIDMMIRRVDAREAADPGRGGQAVIDGLYNDITAHALGGRRYPRSKTDPHLAMYRTDSARRILDKGGFTDTNAARHAIMVRDIRSETFRRRPRSGTPPYRPAASPFVYSTPRPTPPVPGAGGWDDGIIFTDRDRAVLDQDIGGGRTYGQAFGEYKTKIAMMKRLAQKVGAGTATPGEQALLTRYTKEFGKEGIGLIDAPDTISALTADDVNSLAARAARYGLEIKLGVRDAKGKIVDNRHPWVRKYDNATSAVKAMQLLNIANVLPYTTRQVLGNASTLGIANRDALREYVASPGNWRAIMKRETGGLMSGVKTDVDNLRDAVGLGSSNRIRMSSRTGTLGSVTPEENRTGLGKFFSPDRLRQFSQISDLQMREALYKSTFEPGYARLRKNIRLHAEARAGTMGVTISPAQLDNVFSSLPAKYNAIDLRNALERSGATGANVKDWADRVARDYLGATPNDAATGFKGLRAIDDDAFREMERVAFTFNETNLDAVLNRITFYHYWNSRAGLLYAREMLRNPALVASYYRITEGLKQEAERERYPDYLRGWIEFLGTPLGLSAYADPKTFFNTFSTFVESSFRDPNGDLRDLTDLGKRVDDSVFMLNPFLTTALYWSGLLGNVSSKPDPTGLASANRQAVNLINLWLTANNRQPLPGAANVVPAVSNAIASWVSGMFAQLGLDPNVQQKVEFTNPNAAFENNKNWMVQTLLKQNNPTWDDQRIADEAAEIQDDWSNSITQQAADLAADIPYQQPTFGLPGVAGQGAQFLMNVIRPVNVVGRPTQKDYNQNIRGQLRDNKGTPLEGTYADPQTGAKKQSTQGIYSRNDAASAPSLEEYAFNRMIDGYRNVGTEEQRTLADVYDAIVSGQGTSPVSVDGQAFAPDDIAQLDESQRKQLAKLYLNEQGKWDDLQGLWAAKEQYRQSNPQLTDYWAFEDAANTYPAGIEAWARDAMRNPDYARYVADQERIDPNKAVPGTGLRNDMLTSPDAYRILMGQRVSVYDREGMAPPGDYGPYIPGVPVGMTPSQAQNLGGGEGEAGGKASGSSFMDDKKATLQNELGNFYGMVGIMNAWDAQMGYTPGTSVQRYVDRVRTGDKKITIDDGLYDQIKASYDYVFPSKNDLKGFLTWAFDPSLNPDGQLNIDAYLEYDSIEYARKQLLKPVGGKAPSNIGELTSGLTTVRGADGSGPSGTTQPAVYTPTIATPMLADPTNPYSQLTQLGPGLPLTVLRRQGSMALVQAPNGAQGWIPVGNLKRAA